MVDIMNWFMKSQIGEFDLIRRFHQVYFYGGKRGQRLHKNISWFGVPIVKCPLDLHIYQEILFATQPDVIIETGVHYGGSTLYLAHMCDLLDHGEVVACDITLVKVANAVRDHPRIRLLEGSSVSNETVKRIRDISGGRRAMVVLDSDHNESHVRKELDIYSDLVAPDCYLVCEDSNINGHPVRPDSGPGPFEAIESFLRDNPEWESDVLCERLLITYNPKGYLKRRTAPSYCETVST